MPEEQARASADALDGRLPEDRVAELERTLGELGEREAELRRTLVEAHDRFMRSESDLADAREAARRRETEHEAALAQLRERLADAEGALARAQAELAAREEQVLHLTTRLDRILQSPVGRLYARLRALPGFRLLARLRTVGFAAEVARRSSRS